MNGISLIEVSIKQKGSGPGKDSQQSGGHTMTLAESKKQVEHFKKRHVENGAINSRGPKKHIA